MNNRELKVKDKYEQDGWKMLRGGAPDYIALRVDGEGKITEFEGVEVKRNGAKLSYEQGIYRMIFQKAGIPFRVEIVK